MDTFLWVVLGFIDCMVLAIAAVRLDYYELSDFALQAQFSHKDDVYSRSRVELAKYMSEMRALQFLELLILASATAILTWQLHVWYIASVLIGAQFLLIATLSRFRLIQMGARLLYESLLDIRLRCAKLFSPLWKLVGLPATRSYSPPHSHEELRDRIRRLPGSVIAPIERQRLELVLAIKEKTVKDIMTPRRQVIAVDPKATLGPVVLADLQKTRHGYFPVLTRKGDPEGVLDLHDVADIHTAKTHQKISEIMETQLCWVYETDLLEKLAQTILTEKRYVLLVRNEADEFSGLVTLADLLKHTLSITHT